MKHLLTILLCISVSALAVEYQEGWYSLDGDDTEREVEVSLMQSDTSCVSILYEVPGFYLEQDDDSTE